MYLCTCAHVRNYCIVLIYNYYIVNTIWLLYYSIVHYYLYHVCCQLTSSYACKVLCSLPIMSVACQLRCTLHISVTACQNGATFQCGNGLCIALSRKCNGIIDCNDGRDETTCPDGPYFLNSCAVNCYHQFFYTCFI